MHIAQRLHVHTVQPSTFHHQCTCAHAHADANAAHLPLQILELPITLEWAWELVRHFRNNGTLSTSSVDALATLAAVRLGECSNVMHLDVPPGAGETGIRNA